MPNRTTKDKHDTFASGSTTCLLFHSSLVPTFRVPYVISLFKHDTVHYSDLIGLLYVE